MARVAQCRALGVASLNSDLPNNLEMYIMSDMRDMYIMSDMQQNARVAFKALAILGCFVCFYEVHLTENTRLIILSSGTIK
jgi:hypothetical protein